MAHFKHTLSLFVTCAAVATAVAQAPATAAPSSSAQSSATSETFGLKKVPDRLFQDSARSREVLAAQILLDRREHSPGVIDGLMGGNTRAALNAYRRANGMAEQDGIGQELFSSLREKDPAELITTYEITEEDVAGPFVDIPAGFAEKEDLDELGYESPAELLAEKFHLDEDFLRELNPGADFGKAGTTILVAAIGEVPLGTKVNRIVVDKASGTVQAYGGDEELLASYPATIGSDSLPSPSGTMKVKAVAPEPKYYFSPEGREWGPDRKLTIAAGPNNPVGATWIDLTKEGYGIHGSPDPHMVGKRTSHGCVRLTNWDADQLASAVDDTTEVIFK